METELAGKNILIVQGSSLAADALRTALIRAGARVNVTAMPLNAFDLLRRVRFDGAVLDQGLHNEIFDLCEELRDLGVPYILCSTPHRLQGLSARTADAAHAVWRLGHVMSRAGENVVPIGKMERPTQARAYDAQRS